MMKTKDLTGQTFGLLKVLYQVEDYISPKGVHHPMWMCECQCEKHNRKVINGYVLTRGESKSCGCIVGKHNKRYNTYDLTQSVGIGYTQQNDIFYFDKKDYDIIKDYCWNKDTHGYFKTLYEGHKIYLHRLIMGLNNNTNEKIIVDHINHNLADNRKENLRITDTTHNLMNSIIRKDNKSSVRGVSYNTNRNMWESKIAVYGKEIFLGRFKNFEDAVKARKEAEEKYFGDYSYDNSMKLVQEVNI